MLARGAAGGEGART